MNQIWAKQQFSSIGKLEKLDKNKLIELLFSISCQTRRAEIETSRYDGVGYEKHTTISNLPTDMAKVAYELMKSSFE